MKGKCPAGIAVDGLGISKFPLEQATSQAWLTYYKGQVLWLGNYSEEEQK